MPTKRKTSIKDIVAGLKVAEDAALEMGYEKKFPHFLRLLMGLQDVNWPESVGAVIEDINRENYLDILKEFRSDLLRRMNVVDDEYPPEIGRIDLALELSWQMLHDEDDFIRFVPGWKKGSIINPVAMLRGCLFVFQYSRRRMDLRHYDEDVGGEEDSFLYRMYLVAINLIRAEIVYGMGV